MGLGIVDQVLLALAVLMAKHMIADFVLQTGYQWRNKGIYGHPGGLVHAGLHAILTPLVFLVLPPHVPAIAAGIMGGEFLIHYHLDWLKEQFVKSQNVDPTSDVFWRAIGLDQLAHGLTYLAIVKLLVA